MLRKKCLLFSAATLAAVAILLLLPAKGVKSTREVASLPERTNLLCVGLDAAAGNTDVLMLVSFDRTAKEISVLQIPRDTYFASNTAQSKINQLYPHYRIGGKGERDALSALSAELSAALGVRVDGYMAADLSLVSLFVDEIGGVTVEVPAPIRHLASDGEGYIEIPAGECLLFGREAVEFLRFRAGYIEGDLGRVDAQKLLLASMYRKVRDDVKLPLLLSLAPKLYGRMKTDLSLATVLAILRDYYSAKGAYTVRLSTLPGEATRASLQGGLSYYAANRKAAGELLARYFGGDGFDKGGRFLYEGKPHFENIYYDENMAYTVFTDDTLNELDIKTKKK